MRAFAFALLLATACNGQPLTAMVGTVQDADTQATGTQDLFTSSYSDMAAPPDLGPNCGMIAVCVLDCGPSNVACATACAAGASAAETQKANAVGACAFEYCFDRDAGYVPFRGLFDDCPNCAPQVMACDGLIPPPLP